MKAKYQSVVEQVLRDYAEFLGKDDEVQMELVFDQERDRYLLIETGWHDSDRIYGTLLHIDMIDGKLWIQHDGTEEGIANELVAAGVSKDTIVLGFKSVERRQLTEFAVSSCAFDTLVAHREAIATRYTIFERKSVLIFHSPHPNCMIPTTTDKGMSIRADGNSRNSTLMSR